MGYGDYSDALAEVAAGREGVVSGVTWEDPPEAPRARGSEPKWPALLEPLMARPGAWARVKTCADSHRAARIAHFLRAGARLPAGRWFKSARFEDGTAGVYARYLGPEPAPSVLRGVS